MVNKKHQEILNEQMTEKIRPKKGKMNVDELLQNKGKFKKIAENDPNAAEHLQKALAEELKR